MAHIRETEPKVDQNKNAKTKQSRPFNKITLHPARKQETEIRQRASEPIITQEELKAIQPTATQVIWPEVQPIWPSWPRSKPGPHSTPPVPGMHSVNAFRPEQYVEVSNPEATEPPTGSIIDDRTSIALFL
jgi:hypothetical protein